MHSMIVPGVWLTEPEDDKRRERQCCVDEYFYNVFIIIRDDGDQ